MFPIRDCAVGPGRVLLVGEAGRDLEDPLRGLAATPWELLLEQVPDLGAGHRLGDEAVAERLDGEGFAIGDFAWRLGTRWGEEEAECGPAADAAGVHEGDLGAAQVDRLCGHELGVGDHVTRRDLAEGVGAVQDVLR